MGQNWHNFYFEGTTQNNTVPNCFFARLRISPIHDDDQSRQIVLKLQNQYGAKQNQRYQAQYSSDKLNVHDSMTYTDDVNRGIYGSSPNGGMAGEVSASSSSTPSPQLCASAKRELSSSLVENPYDAAVHAAFSESRMSSV
uniref:Uncharacterized protein n=1 Tax=Ditylenchus dipsaci TaxID=166011 RepID=A0A915EMR0_9BILA